MKIGSLQIDISLLTRQLASQMKTLTKNFSSMGKSLNQSFNGAFGQQAQKNINNSNKAASNFGNTLRDVGRIASGIMISQVFYNATNAIQGSIAAVVNFTANMEDARVSLKYFFNSSEEEANAYLEVMKDFAAVTPYATEQVVALSRKLLGARFKPENIKPIMEILTDAASATGGTAEQMDRIILAMAQVKTNGKLAGQEVRQFAEAGIPIYEILQEQLGLTADQMRNLGDIKIDGDLAVAGILKGLERYKGATAELNENFKGTWNNIKDDVLFQASAAFEAPYNLLKGSMDKMRDTLERGRIALQQRGRGGMFEALVPKDMQENVKIVIASLDRLWQAAKNFGQTIGPIFATFGKLIVTALAIALPPLVTMAENITYVTKAAVNAVPPIKYLGVALVGLLVGTAVSRTLLLVWRVMKFGTIATTVAKSVIYLGKAMQFLAISMYKNKVIPLLLAGGAALAYFTGTARAASDWVGKIVGDMAGLSGIDTSGILNPEEGKDIDAAMAKYNQRLKEMDGKLKDVGKNAEKAGKKVKDKFVASFDELYQVPDMLDEVQDGIDLGGLDDIGDIGDIFDDPDFKIPDILPSKEDVRDWAKMFAGIVGITLVPTIAKLIKWLRDKLKKPPEGGGGGGGGGGGLEPEPEPAPEPKPIPVPTPKPLPMPLPIPAPPKRDGMSTEEWKKAFEEWNKQVDAVNERNGQLQAGAALVIPSLNGLANAFGLSGLSANSFSIAVQNAINGLVSVTGPAIANWALNNQTAINTFATNPAIPTWASLATSAILGMTAVTMPALVSWATNSLANLSAWSLGSKTAIDTMTMDTNSKLSQWSINSLTPVNAFATNAAAMLDNFKLKAKSIIDGFSNDTTTAVDTAAVTSNNSIKTFVDTSIATFVNWATEVGKNVNLGVQNMTRPLGTFSVTAPATMGTAANGMSLSLNTGITAMSTNMNTWITSSIGNLNTWASKAIELINSVKAAMAAAGPSVAPNVSAGPMAAPTLTAAPTVDWAKTMQYVSAWNTTHASSESSATLWDGFKNIFSKEANAGAIDMVKSEVSSAEFQAGVATILGFMSPAILAELGASAGISQAALKKLLEGSLKGLPGFSTGTIIDKEMVARVGEGNRREAIIPMENSGYMKPFSAAVANDLVEILGGGQQTIRGGDERPILYVGTLIADDRSLKELERKMELIRVQESQRKGK